MTASCLPFVWQLRLSKRAKYPKITLDKYGVVELVWPASMPQDGAIRMLQQHEHWVVKHLGKLPAMVHVHRLPERIDLLAIGLDVTVEYLPSNRKHPYIEESDEGLQVYAASCDESSRLALCHWLKQQGKIYLKPWLEEQAEEMGLCYANLTMRLQKRRWGSCSAAKRINLNAALLFLPPILVQHVLIHELCHLKHLNHSASFWAEVAKYDVDYAQHRQALRQQSSLVPLWVTQGF